MSITIRQNNLGQPENTISQYYAITRRKYIISAMSIFKMIFTQNYKENQQTSTINQPGTRYFEKVQVIRKDITMSYCRKYIISATIIFKMIFTEENQEVLSTNQYTLKLSAMSIITMILHRQASKYYEKEHSQMSIFKMI